MENIEIILNKAKEYYTTNGLPIPNSVTSYVSNYPPGLSRQVLSSTYNMKCSELVKLLDPNYQKPLNAQERAIEEGKRLNYTIISDISLLKSNRDTLTIKYNECGHIHSATIISLSGTKLGCRLCKSSNLAWKNRSDELSLITKDIFNAEIVSDIPDTQTGYITLKHVCGAEYTTQLLGIVNPNTKLRGTCPNCRPTDRRVVENNITFGSQFEADCYKILQKFNPEIHVPYSKYFITNRRWVCDFKIGNYWIEVSNFKQDYKNYFQNIEEKQALVETNEAAFFFVRSLKELEDLASLM